MKLDSKYFDSIRIKPGKRKDAKPEGPVCEWDGCEKPGTHRAPKGRDQEGQYHQFCVDHVRQYNKSYNYFSGLGDEDISQAQKDAMTGGRPTWAMGTNTSANQAPPPRGENMRSGSASYYNRLRDPHGFIGSQSRSKREAAKPRKAKTLEKKALETLSLTEDATKHEITARYKQLVKTHHPDANGGDRASEDRFREVVQAYRLLKQAGFC